jgi:protein-L-isoaspartate(D-aspartate) O-methyltransferase
MAMTNFIQDLHGATKRDYVARVSEFDKAQCAEVAKQYGYDYWDGERQYGYGGYRYDGRWRSVAEKMCRHYQLAENARILDIGCGKGYLLYEFTQLLPQCQITGLDISEYAIENAKPEVKDRLMCGNASELPFDDSAFDLVISNGALHNLKIYELTKAIQEVERVRADKAWICVESYRNERERANLLYWQLTCESFYSVDEWEWLYKKYGYQGDYEFIYFE